MRQFSWLLVPLWLVWLLSVLSVLSVPNSVAAQDAGESTARTARTARADESESQPRETQPETPRSESDLASDDGKIYRRYFLELKPRDVEGHLWLAHWCIELEQYALAARQARYVLKIDPESEEARRLKHEAHNGMTRLREIEAAVPDPAIPPGKWDPVEHKEFLSKAEINRLRFAEILPLPLRDLRRVAAAPAKSADDPNAPPRDHLRVQFDETVRNDFLAYMSDHTGFDEDAERNLFLRLRDDQQLQLIEYYAGDRFSDRIEIRNDPWAFREFRSLLPSILANCATSGCHGGRRAEVFRLRTTRKGSAANVYTNFLILNRLEVGPWPMVNRVTPERSLLLQYGLPPNEAVRPHPIEIRPLFPDGQRNSNYDRFLYWIRNLRAPRPETEIELPGYPERPPPGAMIGKATEAGKDNIGGLTEPGDPTRSRRE